MTRCSILDTWFDAESKKVNERETKTKVDFVTGQKRSD